MHELLAHVLGPDCSDPDCEVHNPEAADYVDPINLAFFLAGAQAMESLIQGMVSSIHPETMQAVWAELKDQLVLNGTPS